MTKFAVKVENLSKKYLIEPEEKPATWTQKLSKFFDKEKKKDFWALKDINFEVGHGEVLGIIGRNGAGKSTLLKILSQITPPTTGKVQINGRVSSLLEVGTGFHPELTGRENIFLNGAILGMSREEIRRKFTQIIAFADIGKFLDTPVKHYSSGMYVRLAFAIAAHLEPEILVVDEVLSVGDFQFQKKSLGRMNEMSEKGRTVLFVSHNMPMVELLCDRTILLEKGVIQAIGPTPKIVQQYYAGKEKIINRADFSRKKIGDEIAQLISAQVCNARGERTTFFEPKDEVIVEIKYRLKKNNAHVTPALHVYSSEGVCVFITSDARLDPRAELKAKAGTYLARCVIPGNLLNCGSFYLGISLATMFPVKVHFFEKDLFKISVSTSIRKVVNEKTFYADVPGVVRPILKWESVRLK